MSGSFLTGAAMRSGSRQQKRVGEDLTGGASRKPRLVGGFGRAIMSGSFLSGKPRPVGGELHK
jgi:hypothetical protein